MGIVKRSRSLVRFGAFEADLQTGELRRRGLKIKLQEQPFRVLALLLEHPGEMVTRQQLQQAIWSAGTFVDFQEGLDAAIYRLRHALGDSSENPQYVETLAGRGYRFIGQVEDLPPGARETGIEPEGEASRPVSVKGGPRQDGARWRARTLAGVGIVAAVAAALLLFDLARLRHRPAGENQATGAAIRSLAVLPLENLSRNPSQEYFADGMTEALTTDLGKIAELRVVSRTSAMHYSGTQKTLPEIARELGVDAVVEGAVARSGNRVRITAQLIQARSDRHLWAGSYEGDVRDALALQDEVARDIAQQVQIELSSQERSRLVGARAVDPTAEEEYFQGRYERNKWTEEGLKSSIGYFDQAVQRDPDYAPAWAGLAGAYDLLGIFGYMPRNAALLATQAAAEKALKLDGTLSEAHVSLGSAMWPLTWSVSGSGREALRAWGAAEKEFELAIALNPNDAMAHQWRGYHLVAMGRFDDAIAEMKRARELDPLSPNTQNSLGAALYWAARYTEALSEFRKVPDPDANSERRHERIARIYERQGMPEKAIAELVTAMGLAGKQDLALAVQRKYQSLGYREAREAFLKGDIREGRQRAGSSDPPVAAFHIAADYALLGEKQEALRWLEEALRQRDGLIEYLKVDDRFEGLRSDPRFRNLLARMGLL